VVKFKPLAAYRNKPKARRLSFVEIGERAEFRLRPAPISHQLNRPITLADAEIQLVEGGDTAGNEVLLNRDGDIRQVQVVPQNLAIVSKLRTHRGEEQREPSHSSPAEDQQTVRAMASKGTAQRHGLPQTLRSRRLGFFTEECGRQVIKEVIAL
jgi:hypothetical protein